MDFFNLTMLKKLGLCVSVSYWLNHFMLIVTVVLLGPIPFKFTAVTV